MSGVLITFEGPDASGKTTQIHLLEETLRQNNIEPLLTREPGGTPIGEKIRDLLLDRESAEMVPMTEMLLYAASRAQHVEQIIRPALAEGRVVISDRFTDSSIAYQGYGRGLGALVEQVNSIATAGLRPDLTFLLMTTPESMRTRIDANQEDRMEAEKDEFHRAVLEGFRKIGEKDPERIVMIDGSRSIGEIAGVIEAKAMEVIRRQYE